MVGLACHGHRNHPAQLLPTHDGLERGSATAAFRSRRGRAFVCAFWWCQSVSCVPPERFGGSRPENDDRQANSNDDL
jgi:hypothetical protein